MSQAQPEHPDAQAAQVLFPGREVPVLDGRTSVYVYPLGIEHLEQFSGQISTMLSMLGSLPTSPPPVPSDFAGDDVGFAKAAAQWQETRAAYGQAILRRLTPFLLESGLGLVKACVVLPEGVASLGKLPHWDLPKIVEAFVLESFGEERKWRPWVEVLDRAVAKVTGTPFSILEIISSSSSGPATR